MTAKGHLMIPASRTPEGESNACHVCGSEVTVDPSRPPGDAPCPSCGALLWFAGQRGAGQTTREVIDRLAERGVTVDVGAGGEIVGMVLTSDVFGDSAVQLLASITGLRTLDIRGSSLSPASALRLRELMPYTEIIDS